MDTFSEIIKFLNEYITIPLFYFFLIVYFSKKLFKIEIINDVIITWVRYFIIGFSVFKLLNYIIGFLIIPEEFAFSNRATGPYWWAYWLMLIGSLCFPLLLFIKRFKLSIGAITVVLFMINIGRFFERFVIIVTSFHRDYLP